ncbi:MAG: aminoglycoside phosphotransferase family protein [Pseudomonadota bacterium]
MTDLQTRCRRLVAELKLGSEHDVEEVEPLTGGVASDIARVRVKGKNLCVKFALPQLKVEATWLAPVHRNAADYAWLRVAHEVSPQNAVELLGHSESQSGFAMAFLEGDGVYLWKAALLKEAPDRGEAAAVGDLLGRVHAASSEPTFDARPFQNHDDFRALRIEPYLLHTAKAHAAVAPALKRLANMLHAADRVLVHGDVSPKNIFFRAGSPVLLDAECATMGDASFDPAFCLNHLVLKAVHLQASRAQYLASVCALWGAYVVHATWENATALEQRVCRLLPALMLARIDGKSPVEYLSDPDRDRVRQLALGLLAHPTDTLSALVKQITEGLIET